MEVAYTLLCTWVYVSLSIYLFVYRVYIYMYVCMYVCILHEILNFHYKTSQAATGKVETVFWEQHGSSMWRLMPTGGEGGQAEMLGLQEWQQWHPYQSWSLV